MSGHWLVIEREGVRAVPVAHMQRSVMEREHAWEVWPSFACVALRTSTIQAERSLSVMAKAMRAGLYGEHGVAEWRMRRFETAHHGVSYFELSADEPVLEETLVTDLMAEIGGEGAYVRHTEEGTIQMILYHNGMPTTAWWDGDEPWADNIACTFHEDGRCTQEDSRLYALRAMELPETTQLLDRYGFVESMLFTMGLESVTRALGAWYEGRERIWRVGS